jgi:hypothetical protein
LAYIWYLRGQVITPSKKGKKTGYGKYRRGRNTLPLQQKKKRMEDNEPLREEAQLMAQRKLLERPLDSPDEDASEYGQRRRRRRVQELFYNPNKHVRRRDLAELLGNRCFGCGQVFDVVSLLERHIPNCPDKDKILGSSEGLANKQTVVEADDSDNEYDANKHMCIYCERYFTYLGMLRKHVVDTCAKRRELVESGDYLDEEWEADLDVKTGHSGSGRRTLSRQSSMSSLNGVLADDVENSQDSFDQRPRRRRRRRGHNWGYKPKGSKRRMEEGEGDSPYMIEESFFADIESSNSRAVSHGEDESSNDSVPLATKLETPEKEEKVLETKPVDEIEVKKPDVAKETVKSKPVKTTAASKTKKSAKTPTPPPPSPKKEVVKKTAAKKSTPSKKKVVEEENEEEEEEDMKLSELAKKRKSKSPNPTPKKTKNAQKTEVATITSSKKTKEVTTVNGSLATRKKRKSDETVDKKPVKKARSKQSLETEKPKPAGKKT